MGHKKLFLSDDKFHLRKSFNFNFIKFQCYTFFILIRAFVDVNVFFRR